MLVRVPGVDGDNTSRAKVGPQQEPGDELVPLGVGDHRLVGLPGLLGEADVGAPSVAEAAKGEGGYSSSLAAATLRDLGLRRGADLVGGFQAWMTIRDRDSGK